MSEKRNCFDIINQNLGDGDASPRGIWFVGIEPGGSITNAGSGPWSPWLGSEDYRVVRKMSRILSPGDADEYRRNVMLKEGAGISLSNLYPLARPSLAHRLNFRDDYGLEDNGEYNKLVMEKRWPLLREEHDRLKPAVTFCFGKTFWKEFKCAFEIKSEPLGNLGRAEFYDDNDRKFILTHHLSYPWFVGRKEIEAIQSKLDELGVKVQTKREIV